MLHRDELLSIGGLAERVYRADVWVIQGGGGARLLSEARNAGRIRRDVRAQHLERHLTVEHHIARQPDLAHAAAPEPLDDFVSLDAGT